MVRRTGYSRYLAAWCGLILSPAAWLASTQFNFALASWQCVHKSYPIPWVALFLAVIAMAGGLVSFSFWRRQEDSEASLTFAAGVATLLSALLMLVILLQGLAGLIFTGCER
jgi:hypothetical protein